MQIFPEQTCCQFHSEECAVSTGQFSCQALFVRKSLVNSLVETNWENTHSTFLSFKLFSCIKTHQKSNIIENFRLPKNPLVFTYKPNSRSILWGAYSFVLILVLVDYLLFFLYAIFISIFLVGFSYLFLELNRY